MYGVFAALLVGGCGGAQERGKTPRAASGAGTVVAKMVDFEWSTLDGETIHLADSRGKVVVVTFFTTWCVPCAELLPQLNRLVTGKSPVDGLMVIAVNVDLTPKKLVPTFLEYWRITVPVVLGDAAALHGRTPFGDLVAVPTTYLIDPEGRHVETLVGMLPTAYIRRRATSLLGAAR